MIAKNMMSEKENVNKIYDIIANDFSRTRYSVWKSVEEFIHSFPKEAQFLEIGCGNGKNMLLRPNNFTGCDFCGEFLKICKERNLNVIQSCATALPFKNNMFDSTLSVAVIHHFITEKRRIKAIQEQIRVTKIDGKIFIEVWGFENNSKVIDGNPNSLVPWKYKNETYYRYYHFFKKQELIDIVNTFTNVKIEKIYWEKYNWIIILKKIF